MNRNFEHCLKKVLRHEGGYVDDPKDPGGATNKGITIATFRRFIKKGGTKADLKKLTTKQAGIVYKKRYWDTVKGDELPDGLDYAVFDFSVNSGPKRAKQFLQRALGVSADGSIGPVTLQKISEANPAELSAQLCDNRLSWMRGLGHWPRFGKGWTRRVKEVRKESMRLAYESPAVVIETPRTVEPASEQLLPETVTVEKPVAPAGLDKPMRKSKTLWSQIGVLSSGFGASAVSAYTGLDPKVQLALIAACLVALAGCAIFAISERRRYRNAARKIEAADA